MCGSDLYIVELLIWPTMTVAAILQKWLPGDYANFEELFNSEEVDCYRGANWTMIGPQRLLLIIANQPLHYMWL